MDYYFLSNTPYYLKVNGNYIGKVTKNLKVLQLLPPSFMEFLPACSDFLPCYSDLKSLDTIKKYPFNGGEIILPIFNKKPHFSFKILGQKHFDYHGYTYLLSVVLDGTVKFYVDGKVAIIETLPFIPETFDIYTFNHFVFFTFSSQKTAIIGYDFSTASPTLIFKDIASDFTLDSLLKIKKCYDFTNPIEVLESWDLSTAVTLQSRTATPLKPLTEIPKNLIALSFMESVSVMGDLSIYLTPELNARAQDIYEFIKKPLYLFYPPNTFSEVVLLTENEIFTYKFEFNGNLICNLIEK